MIITEETLNKCPKNKRVNKKINSLYDEGNTVVYWTARGATTGIDWTELTMNQLKQWGAKYTEAKLGKPNYDVFICDKAINTSIFFGEELK